MKLTVKHGHQWMYLVLTHTAKALFNYATNLSHVATAVEVSQGSALYVAQSSELVKQQQAHVVIEIHY